MADKPSQDFLSAAPRAPGNLPEYTVGEISAALKRTLEEGFARVRVRGEISGFKRHSSGHLYFSLKDEDAVLNAVCWRGSVGRLGLVPEDGMAVIATGRITAYAPRSNYQIVVEAMDLAGEGALLKLLEERRKKLAAEGLFAAERKVAIPYLPEVIGVVTSPTGAVIRDILHRLADRFPRRVLVWPVAVQGEGAADQVARAIAGFNALAPGGRVPRPDVIIVARGGGSLEDLWAFNEEIVVRAAAASEIPLISAVGHETDTTLIDFAADMRAPTPTAAAEMAVPVRGELMAEVLDHARRMVAAGARLLGERRTRVEGLGRGLGDPKRLLEAAAQRVDFAGENAAKAMRRLIDGGRARVAELGAALPHPRQVLRVKLEAFKGASRRLRPAMLKQAIQQHRKDTDALSRALALSVKRIVEERRARFTAIASLLDSLSYERVLDRGFALVRDASGHAVTSAAALSPGQDIAIRFRDGDRKAVVAGGAPAPGRGRAKGAGGQGSLL
jgi:exodeoxyribonuclease VII large subunit